MARGRRAGFLGANLGEAPGAIWNAAWGIDPDRSIAPVPTPSSEVIEEALRLYQSELRKPSLTIWVLDTSGSMDGEPIQQLQEAMGLLLDPDAAALNLLQPSSRDITIIIPFNSTPGAVFQVVGDDPAELELALTRVDALTAGGGTDLYAALAEAFQQLGAICGERINHRLSASGGRTDGRSVRYKQPWCILALHANAGVRRHRARPLDCIWGR